MSIQILQVPYSVYDGFINYVTPLARDAAYDPYKPENFLQMRYALERKFWQLLQAAPERQQAEEVMDVITQTREGKGPAGFVLRGFPVDWALPATPTARGNHTTNGKGFVSEMATLAVMSSLDQVPISVPGFYGGSIIQQISPRHGEEMNGASGMGSQVAFGAHTDTSFIPQPPNFFALTCLRNFERAKTNLAFARDVLAYFSEAEIKVMEEPTFTFDSGRSMDHGAHNKFVGAILTYSATQQPLFRFNIAESRTTSPTRQGADVIERLSDVLDFARNPGLDNGIILEKGDALFFDNQQCLHARTAFTPYEDSTKRRWLQRVLTTRSEEREQPFPGGR